MFLYNIKQRGILDYLVYSSQFDGDNQIFTGDRHVQFHIFPFTFDLFSLLFINDNS
jgi:hypothetical protein